MPPRAFGAVVLLLCGGAAASALAGAGLVLTREVEELGFYISSD